LAFAYGLRELLQFAGAHLVTSLLAFNAAWSWQLAVLCLSVLC